MTHPNLREDLRAALVAARPNLAASSVTSYVGRLFNIPKNLRTFAPNIGWFARNTRTIVKSLENVAPATRKNILSPLYLLTNDPAVHEAMLADAKATNEAAKSQKKSATQEANWITWEQVQNKYVELAVAAKPIWKKRTFSENDLEKLSNFVLLAMYVHFPPRRSADYALMKIAGPYGDSDNSLNDGAKTMTFRVFKTKKVYGEQTFDVPPLLRRILNDWKKINPSDYLMYNRRNAATSSSSLTKIMNKIFNANVSSSMLRHSFLSEIYGVGKPNLSYAKKTELSEKMAHNITTAELYSKK